MPPYAELWTHHTSSFLPFESAIFDHDQRFFNHFEMSGIFSNNVTLFLFYFNSRTFLFKYKSIILLKNEVNVFYGQIWLMLKALWGGRNSLQSSGSLSSTDDLNLLGLWKKTVTIFKLAFEEKGNSFPSYWHKWPLDGISFITKCNARLFERF